MKRFIKLFTLLFAFIAGSTFAGNADTTKHSYLGIGVRANLFTNSDITTGYLPPARISLSVDPIRYLRFEGQFSYLKSTYEVDLPSGSGTRPETFTDKSNLFSLGTFGMYKIQSSRFYLGIRWSKSNYSSTDYETTWGPNGTVSTVFVNKGEITSFSEVFGGEHFFGRHFSVGAEFSLVSAKNFFVPGAQGEDSENSSYKGSESAIMFRFYPF
jgi:hypothetical protein